MACLQPRNFLVLMLPVLLAVAVGPRTSDGAENPRFMVSVDAATMLDATKVRDRDLVSIRQDGAGLQVMTAIGELLPDGVDLDALSLLHDNRGVFSTSVSFNAHGVEADDEDLVLYDYGSLSVAFDGSASGLPAAADLDAVHLVTLNPIEIYYSVDSATRIGNLLVGDDDIIRFDGTNHTVVVHGQNILGDQAGRADVDALWWDSSRDEYVLSFDVSIPPAAGRTAAAAADLVLWSNGSLLMYFDASEAGLSAPGLDLDAASLSSTIFADGFESGDTTRWSMTTS